MAVQGVLHQSILNVKLIGRKKLGRKMCTSYRDDSKLENTVKQSRFKHLGERSELKLESVHQESPRSDVFRKRATKPLLKQKQRQKHLTWAKEKKDWTGLLLSGLKFSFQIKVNFAFHLEIKVPESGGRVESLMLLEVQCEVSTVSDDLGCHVICWCWFTVFSVHSPQSMQASTRKF